MNNLLQKLKQDYSHPWPNEDELTKEHRLNVLNDINSQIKNNLSLNFFCSTRTHFNSPNIYKFTLNNLFEKSSIFRNSFKIAHIKIIPNQQEIAAEIENTLKETYKFDVILKTIGNWNNDESHHHEYLKDICKLFDYPALSNYKYGYWMESDWIHLVDNFDKYINDAIHILENNSDLLTLRYTRIDDNDIITRTGAIVGGGFVDSNTRETTQLFRQSKEFSFNPTFIRNRDIHFISKFVLKNKLHGHCERAMGLGANYLNSLNNDLGFYGNYFSFIDNKIIEHIGCPEMIKKYGIV